MPSYTLWWTSSTKDLKTINPITYYKLININIIAQKIKGL